MNTPAETVVASGRLSNNYSCQVVRNSRGFCVGVGIDHLDGWHAFPTLNEALASIGLPPVNTPTMTTTYTVTYEDPGFSWAVWQDGQHLAGGYADTKHSAENDARIWIAANVPVVSPTHADLVDGESYDIGRQGCGVWNAQLQTFTMWDGRVIGVLDTPYSPYVNAPAEDCLAETLPQSDSVKAHYAQERVRNAAPELLEALKAIVTDHDADAGGYMAKELRAYTLERLIDAARAAIAKATNA